MPLKFNETKHDSFWVTNRNASKGIKRYYFQDALEITYIPYRDSEDEKAKIIKAKFEAIGTQTMDFILKFD